MLRCQRSRHYRWLLVSLPCIANFRSVLNYVQDRARHH